MCCLLGCKAFGGSRVKTRRCISRTCVVYLIRPSGGRGLRLEDVSCVVYLIERPSAGRGLRCKDVSRGKKMYVEQTCVVYLIVRPSVGRGEDSKMYLEARNCVLSKLVLFT